MPMEKFPDTQKMKLSLNDTKKIKAHFDRIADFSNLSPIEKKRVYDVFLKKIENNVLHNALEDTEAINAKKKMEEIKRKLVKILESLNLKISGKRLEILTNLLAKKILKEAAEAEEEKGEDDEVEQLNPENKDEKETDENEEGEEEEETDENEEEEIEVEEEEEEEIELAKDIKEELEKTKEELENLKREIELLRSEKNEEEVEEEIDNEIKEEEVEEEIDDETEKEEEETDEDEEKVKEEEIPAMVEAIVQYSLPTLIEKASDQILKSSVIKKKIELYNKLAESFGVKEFVEQVDKLNTINEYLKNIIRIKNEEIDSLKEQLKVIKIKSIKEKRNVEKKFLLNEIAKVLKKKAEKKVMKKDIEDNKEEKDEFEDKITDREMIRKEEGGKKSEREMIKSKIVSKIKERMLIKRRNNISEGKREKQFLLKKLSKVLSEKYGVSEKMSFSRNPLNRLNERSFLNLKNNSTLPIDNPEKMAEILNESLRSTNPIKLESLNQIKKLTE